jgi:hypothetical protein
MLKMNWNGIETRENRAGAGKGEAMKGDVGGVSAAVRWDV